MARPKVFNEMARATELFPPASRKRVERLIERAMRRELRENRRSTKNKLLDRGAQRLGQAATRFVASQLREMLSLRGAAPRQAPSIKQKAPDTGGRPYHFAHSHVSKATTPKGGAAGGATSGVEVGPDAGTTVTGSKSAPAPKAGRSAAHMRYIERDGAVERTGEDRGPGIEAETVEELAAGVGTAKGAARETVGRDGVGENPHRERFEGPMMGTTAGAGQGYVETPRKLENGERVVFSFGTIGATFEERVGFWEALEANELKSGARVQDRLIVELPHEATGEQRHEMVRRFAKEFDDRGLPHWIAMHAPGDRNDSRNYHAHIVYSTRPAGRMVDPADGTEKWDFEVTTRYRTSSRNWKVSHPHRQDRHPDMRKGDAIPRLRRAFAEAVNGVLVRDDVRDAAGEPVRYDARSYKDMGVDVVPMRTINRIVADKLRDGKLTVLDEGHTRKMIEAELREARGRRDQRLQELERMGKAIENWARAPGDRGAASALPAALRPKRWASPSRSVIRKAGKALLEARHSAYAQDVMDRSAQLTLDRIVEATSPASLATPLVRRKAWEAPPPPIDPEVARALHAEAVEARRVFGLEREANGKRLRLRIGRALNAWSAATSRPTVPREPHTEEERRAREEGVPRAGRAARAFVRDRAAVLAEGRSNPAAPGPGAAPLGPANVPSGPGSWDLAGEVHDEGVRAVRRARLEAETGIVGRETPAPATAGAPGERARPVVPTGPGSWEAAADTAPPPPTGAAEDAGKASAAPAMTAAAPVVGPGGTTTRKACVPPAGARPGAAVGARPDILTQWGLVPAQEPSALIARLRRRLDAVVGPIKAIADPEERWEAIQALGRGDAAARAVFDAARPEEKRLIASVAATAGKARSMSADDLVDAAFGAVRGVPRPAPIRGIVGGTAPTAGGETTTRTAVVAPPAGVMPPGGAPVEAGAAQPTGEGVDGKVPIDEEEERLAAAKARRRRQAILSHRRRDDIER